MKKKLLGLTFAVLAWNTATSQCGQFPVLDIGNDIMLCQGASVMYTVPSGYDAYNWNIAPGNQTSVTVTSPTTLILNVVNNTTNLVVNGDFEAGNTGFTSGYTYAAPAFNALYPESTYSITTNPNIVHTDFSNCSDVTTTGPGNMMVVNGSNIPNTTVWSQVIAVDPNTNYSFAAWVTSVKNIGISDVSSLQFFINNVQIGPVFSPTLTACDWQQFSQIWNSGANTSATISIIAQVVSGNNDFALDNITFNTACLQSDTIVVSYDQSTISAGPNVTFCENEPQTITATANYANPNFTWVSGQTGATIAPTSSGNYVVQTTSPNGCALKDTVTVTVKPMPWDFDTIAQMPSECGSNNGAVYVLMNGSFGNNQPIYTWSGPGANNPNQINASVWTNLSPGWYYINVTSNGCQRNDSVLVTPLNPPVADLSANPTSGYGPLSVDFTNGSTNATNFDWNFGNGNTTTTTDLSGLNQVYDSVGTYLVTLVAINGSCTDTASVLITVLPPPIPPVIPPIVPVDLKTPNIFTPNGDNVNDFFTFELLNIKSLDVTIVNRWGNPVYTSSTIPFIWNGKDASGNMMDDGVYFYKYTAKGAQDEPFEGQGFVQLIK